MIKESPKEVARWMQLGAAGHCGVACLMDDSVYLAFVDSGTGRVHVLVLDGGQAWLDAFLAALDGFDCKQAYGKVDFAKAALAFWPDDECVRKFAEMANVKPP
jgi:hypothetical protein